MLTARKVLETLTSAGLIESGEMVREKGWTGHAYSSPRIVQNDTGLSVSDETYGRHSIIYMCAKDRDVLLRARRALLAAGGSPSMPTDYLRIEIQVSPFKGWHWWE